MKSPLRSSFREAVFVLATGLVVAAAANALSPRGLSLSRDYFRTGDSRPRGEPVAVIRSAPTNGLATVPITNSQPEETVVPSELAVPATEPGSSAVLARLAEKGLQVIGIEEVEALANDPRTLEGGILLIDARGDRHYAEGHIPGAYQFDHYHLERHLPTILPLTQAAEQIVIYCTGGQCEDSALAAMDLIDLGVDPSKIFVFAGGITEWRQRGLLVEVGPRLSGNVQQPAPTDP